MAGAGELPSGTVTFLLTDIEGSTRLWQHHPEVMGDAMARHDELVRTAVEDRGGVVVKEKGEGDSTFSVFTSARDAADAAVVLQRSFEQAAWPDGLRLATRAALHTGHATVRDGDYFGTAVNRCARIRSTAHGGQIVCSQATAELLAEDPPAGVVLVDLGTHGLRDLSREERIHQLQHQALRSEFPPLRSLGSARSNLPAQRTNLLGRDEEVAALRERLAAHRLVTLTGVGGCGKTRLAVEVATQELAAFDAAYFCDLSSVAEPDLVVAEVATAVALPSGGPMVPSGRGLRDEVLEHLQDRSALLILDNCEHVLDAAASLVDEILDRCRQVRVVTTSREALEVEGEQTYTVPSLALPRNSDDVHCASVELFCERARGGSPSFVLNEASTPHVVEICRRLDGIPLAIELAAGQLPALTLAQVAGRLSDRFRLLSGGRRRVQRQQTLAAALDWSYDLLSDDERTVLRLLSIFPQPFTLDQAEALVGDLGTAPARVIRSLVNKSLVAISDERLRLLETVRMYAQQRLVDAGEAERSRRRHRDLVLEMVEAIPDERTFTSGAAALAVPELDHVREALRWSEAEGRWDLVARIASRSAFAFSRDLSEVGVWLEKAADADGLSTTDRLRLRAVQAWAAFGSGDHATMVRASEEALALAPDAGGLFHATAHGLLALFHAMVHYLTGAEGADDTARAHIDAARDAAESVEARSFSSAWIGLAHSGLHELEEARSAFAAGVEVERAPDVGTGATYTMLAVVEYLRGDLPAAAVAMERSCGIFASDLWATATGFDSFWVAPYAPVLDALGRHEEATEQARNLVEHLRVSGVPAGFQVTILGALGILAGGRGHAELAVQLLVRGCEAPLSPLDHQLANRAMAEARRALSDGVAEAAMARGRAQPFEEACEAALEALGT
jgi:predicted ATPase/class 3 adenylate cyclase